MDDLLEWIDRNRVPGGFVFAAIYVIATGKVWAVIQALLLFTLLCYPKTYPLSNASSLIFHFRSGLLLLCYGARYLTNLPNGLWTAMDSYGQLFSTKLFVFVYYIYVLQSIYLRAESLFFGRCFSYATTLLDSQCAVVATLHSQCSALTACRQHSF